VIITDQEHVIMASEVGVLDVPEVRIVRKWRLQPGKMVLIDMEEGRIIEDEEIKRTLGEAWPYEQWLDETHVQLEALSLNAEPDDRPDPGRTGDEPGLDDRAAPEPARPQRRRAQAPGGQPADPHRRGPGEDPRGERVAGRRLPDRHAGHHLARLRRRRGAEGC